MSKNVLLLQALFGKSRLMQFLAVTPVYTLGTLITIGQDVDLNQSALLWGYLAVVPTGASIHFANEFTDYETDALTKRIVGGCDQFISGHSICRG